MVKRSGRRAFALCENGCVRSHDGQAKQATYSAFILDWPTELCTACARAWEQMWDGAISPVEQEVSHATPEPELMAA